MLISSLSWPGINVDEPWKHFHNLNRYVKATVKNNIENNSRSYNDFSDLALETVWNALEKSIPLRDLSFFSENFCELGIIIISLYLKSHK